MNVRAIFRAVTAVDGEAPFNVIQLKIHYPALVPQNDTERNSGILTPDKSFAPFPVVLMLNGVNCPPESYAWLALALCRKGCVFVTFNWITDDLPGGLQGLTPGIDVQFMNYENYGKGPTGSAIRPILDDLRKVNSAGLLENCLDLDNVILGGHSAGGSIALMNAGFFPEIKSAFSYGAHTQGSTMMGFPPNYVCPVTSEKPLLLLGGNRDGVIIWSARRYGKTDTDATVALRQTFDKAFDGKRGDRFLVIFDGANHFTFAHPQDATTGRPFLDLEPQNDFEIRALMADMIAEFIEKGKIQQPNNELIAFFESK